MIHVFLSGKSSIPKCMTTDHYRIKKRRVYPPLSSTCLGSFYPLLSFFHFSCMSLSLPLFMTFFSFSFSLSHPISLLAPLPFSPSLLSLKVVSSWSTKLLMIQPYYVTPFSPRGSKNHTSPWYQTSVYMDLFQTAYRPPIHVPLLSQINSFLDCIYLATGLEIWLPTCLHITPDSFWFDHYYDSACWFTCNNFLYNLLPVI